MTFGIKQITERFAVGEHTVLQWIRQGELRAIDVSRKLGGRPKWRVSEESLAEFEALRTPVPPAPRDRSRRKKKDDSVIEFYK